MEVELIPVTATTLPPGLVTSVLYYKDTSTKLIKQDEQPFISLCPSGKLLSLVYPSHGAQFLVPEGAIGGSVTYKTSFQGLLDVPREPMSQKPRPTVTATIVVPIAFKREDSNIQRSSIVVVGFSDGYIRGYSKGGRSVFSQLLHLEGVKRFACMATASGSQRKVTSSNNNLVVLYHSVVCVIEGSGLVELIKKNASSIGAGITGDGDDELMLSHKKWHLLDQTSTSDVTLLAHSTPSAFDHLCEASNVAGFDATIRSAPTPEARLITVGEQPMIALYKITKDAGSLNMSEVMHAVASKMTTAVLGKLSQAGGWLGWGGKTKASTSPKPKAPEEKIQLSSNLAMSTNVPDGRRSVSTITVSPLGNLAAAVDCFGRVLLLECESLVIRRMWKGYRDAQCGWLLVHETQPTTNSKRTQKEKKPPPSAGGNEKKAQCLCIYAPRRGIVELWPVQCGNRLAVFSVGKGCHILYAHHGVFTSESDDQSRVSMEAEERKREKERRMCPDNAVLLDPSGQLMRFVVPFPSLVRMDDPSSHDAYLMKKLPEAIQSGGTEFIEQVFTDVKSSQSLKQAIDMLIGAYPFDDVIPSRFMMKLMNIALARVNENDSLMIPLFQFVCGVRQLVQLVQSLEELNTDDSDTIPPSPDKLEQHLSEVCGLPATLAKNTSNILRTYFTSFSPEKRVTKRLSLKSLVKCFNLPSKVGNLSLSSASHSETESIKSKSGSAQVVLNLKTTLSDSALIDVGHALFMPFLLESVPEDDVTRIFETSGIPSETLLSCLCRLFLVGNVQESNPCLLLERLKRVIAALIKTRDSPDESSEVNLWSEVCEQCASSHNVGHALMMVLVCQHIAAGNKEEKNDQPTKEEEDEEEEEDGWESLTADREHWIRLVHHLEALTLLANVVGQRSMKMLPPAPYAMRGEGGEDGGEGQSQEIDVGTLQLELLSESHKGGGICAVVMEMMGPYLITHCVSDWLVRNETPPTFIAHLPTDPHDLPDDPNSKIVFQLSPLMKLLPRSLSHQSLLLHSAWHAAYQKKYQLFLQFISLISSVPMLQGAAGLVWHQLFEGVFVRTIDALKRGTAVDDDGRQLVSVCRNMFGYLHQIASLEGQAHENTQPSLSEERTDILVIPEPLDRHTLMDVVLSFPHLSPTIIKTYFELNLLTEIVLHASSRTPVNVVTFFPTWLRNAIKKGAFKSAWQDQVPVQLQQKRLKFLRESVSGCLQSGSPKMSPTLPSCALQQLTITNLPQIDVSEFGDFVFLLGEQWALNRDDIRLHWVINLFAAGLGENGKEVFLGVKDKSQCSQELLTLAGCLADQLINNIENKQEKLVIQAQTPPSLMEWLRKQGSSNVKKSCSKMLPNWKALSQLLSLIQPYLSSASSVNSICQELMKLVQLKK